ncbi:MAG: DinB family protein [Phycisphaerae bacterium]
MQIDLIPALIDQFRETFESEPAPWVWITDGNPNLAVLGILRPLPADAAFAPASHGGKSVAAHVAHLRFSLDLLRQRLDGQNPSADWQTSFDLQVPPDLTTDPAVARQAWQNLQQDLRRAYNDVVSFLEARRQTPVTEWEPIQVAGFVAMTAHNAYHLGQIRQLILSMKTL